MKPEPKFKIGDLVIVMEDLRTVIIEVIWDDRLDEYKYYFEDREGKRWYEVADAIELIK